MKLIENKFSKKLLVGILIVVGLLSFFILISLVSYVGSNKENISFEKMYNDNSKIASEADYNITMLLFSSKGHYERFSKFNGVKTLYKINAEEETYIKIDSTLAFKRGNFKIVLVLPSGEVKTVFEYKGEKRLGIFSTKEVRTSEYKIPKGTSYIKVVGFNAKGSYNIKVSEVDEGSKVDIIIKQ